MDQQPQGSISENESKFVIIKMRLEHYVKFCDIIEKDRRIREKARERSRIQRGKDTSSDRTRTETLVYEILSM